MRRPLVLSTLLSCGLGAAGAAASCGGGDQAAGTPADGGAEATLDAGPTDGHARDGVAYALDAAVYPCSGCGPFPSLGATTCTQAVLAPPILVYPEDGVLLPPNLGALEVHFVDPPQAPPLYEVDFENSVTDMRIETPCVRVPDALGSGAHGCGIALTPAQWTDLAEKNRIAEPVAVTVRATVDGSCVSVSNTVKVGIAHDDVTGGLFYWQSPDGRGGGIYGYDFGSPTQGTIPFFTPGANGYCVGCHRASTDGLRMAMGIDDADGDDQFGDVQVQIVNVSQRTVVGPPSGDSGTGVSPGFQAFARNHTSMLASTYSTRANAGLDSFDGDGRFIATSSLGGVLATQPAFDEPSNNVVFVVPQGVSSIGDHHMQGGSLFFASFDPTSSTISSAPQLLLHAPAGGRSYYYPTFAPNGAFVLFDDAPSGDSYFNPGSRVKLLHFPAPIGGQTPLDLSALNGSTAVANTWPRFSPVVQTQGTHLLLWVTFSSTRDYGLRLYGNSAMPVCYPPASPASDQPQPLAQDGGTLDGCARPQVWMAAVYVDDGTFIDLPDRSLPAFWLPFQDVGSHNHSAEWVEYMRATAVGGDAGACQPSGASCQVGTPCCPDAFCCAGTCAAKCSP
jgi:hypothetical protein